MIYAYTLTGIPPSNNEFIGKNRRFQYQKKKHEWTDRILLAVAQEGKPPEPFKTAKVCITYFFSDGRRRDPDNYSGKFILDGLVRSGVLEDDSFSNIELKLKANIDKECPRTLIQISDDAWVYDMG